MAVKASLVAEVWVFGVLPIACLPSWKFFPLWFTPVFLPVCSNLPLSWRCITVKHNSFVILNIWSRAAVACGCAGSRSSQTLWLTPALFLILGSEWSSASRRHGRLMMEQAVCSAPTGGRWQRQQGLDKHETRLVLVEDSSYLIHRLNTKPENKRGKTRSNLKNSNWERSNHSNTTSRSQTLRKEARHRASLQEKVTDTLDWWVLDILPRA